MATRVLILGPGGAAQRELRAGATSIGLSTSASEFCSLEPLLEALPAGGSPSVVVLMAQDSPQLDIRSVRDAGWLHAFEG
jgi:hypothetical protein